MARGPGLTAVSLPLYVAAVVAGYVVGSLNPAATIARIRGIDLRASGSGNPGATNAARTMGRGVGVLVLVLDLLKGFVPAVLFATFVGLAAGEVAGLAAVVGHVTSPFLRGRGGKGVATALGAILGTHAIWALPLLVVFAVTVALTRRVGLGAVAAAVALVPIALLMSDSWHSRAFALLIAAVILLRHVRNVRAALTGGDVSTGR
ncbi:unannotated protein [freshwater metagenome]|uniref:Unannotated protein n=1 Tax=freshwater metagenome TaxID=449393 RepID=A0A6J7Q3M9_9ZZZZ